MAVTVDLINLREHGLKEKQATISDKEAIVQEVYAYLENLGEFLSAHRVRFARSLDRRESFIDLLEEGLVALEAVINWLIP